MPPKKVVNEGGEASTGAGGSVSTLTPKETLMLQAVVSLMGDVPDVNFDQVAVLIGVKYAKNARQSCKKLFEKIRANNPEVAASATAAKTADSEGSENVAPENKKPAGKGKKVIAAPNDDKKIGERAAPKKAKAAAPKKAKAAPKSKKEPTPEIEEAEAEAEESEDGAASHENGKSNKDVLSIVYPADPTAPFVSTHKHGATATFPAGYRFPLDSTDDELWKCHVHEITVEDWRSWKAKNNYPEDFTWTP